MNRLRQPVHSLFRDLLEQPVEELVLRLTLLTLILHGSSSTALDVPLKVICGFLLVSRSHVASPVWWGVVAAFVWWINADDWLWIDNHKFLMSYWVLACTLAAVNGEGRAAAMLAWNGRWLAGLCFAFAAAWKLLGGQYLNGEFFYYSLLVDGRLEFLAHGLGGVPQAELAQCRMLEDAVSRYPGETVRASLPDLPRLQALALAISWWTVLIEAAIAVTFLGNASWMRRWRDVLLLAFIAGTYVLVPVLGFGYVLTILGLAACSPERFRFRAAYLAVLVVVQLGRLPWEDWILFGAT